MKLKEIEKLSLENQDEIIKLKERVKNWKWIITGIACLITILINWLIYYLK